MDNQAPVDTPGVAAARTVLRLGRLRITGNLTERAAARIANDVVGKWTRLVRKPQRSRDVDSGRS